MTKIYMPYYGSKTVKWFEVGVPANPLSTMWLVGFSHGKRDFPPDESVCANEQQRVDYRDGWMTGDAERYCPEIPNGINAPI